MKFISSPAKLMNVENSTEFLKNTTPKFIKDSEFIHSFLKEKSPKYLSELMEISPKLADENWERNQKWTAKPTSKNSAPAMFAFTGEVYRGLDAKTLDEKAVKYLEKNYRILSGLYGLLKPSDKVMLYRLEMGSKLDVHGSKNLYGFWKEILTPFLNSKLKKGEFILNLASNEYAKVLDKKSLKVPMIDVEFQDYKNGELKKIMMYFKHARGAMARYCAENKVETLDQVKAFDVDGYRFDENLSTEETLVFTR